MKSPILTIPGWNNSLEGHWQTLWEKNLNATRVEQDDWETPRKNEWVTRLDQEIQKQSSPPILVAHSLGCIAVAILSKETDCKVAGAFLVAPPDLERSQAPSVLKGFLPYPDQPLRFPSVVVASTNDPYASIERSEFFAKTWGSTFINVGSCGHINLSAGFGPWLEGERLFKDFLYNC